jgi:hypothetical protein
LERLGGVPGSELAAAVGALAAAHDAFARVDLAGEHPAVLSDAALALARLGNRHDAAQVNVLGAVDATQAYARDGALTTGSWFRHRTNTEHATATRLVRTAQRLGDLPLLDAHFSAGDVTLDHVAVITQAAIPQRAAAIAAAQGALTGLALTRPPSNVRAAVRYLADAHDPDGNDDPPDDDDADGDVLLRATLDPLTREALRVLLDAFDTPDDPDTPPPRRRSPAQRRHDAFTAALHTLLHNQGLPSIQGARPQILINIDLATLLGLPAEHPAATTTLTDLAALLDIDLPGITDTPTDNDGDDDAPDDDAAGGDAPDAPGAPGPPEPRDDNAAAGAPDDDAADVPDADTPAGGDPPTPPGCGVRTAGG